VSVYEFRTPPFEHQREALRRSWDREAYALLMQMGTGKTKVVLDNAALLYEKGEINALMVVAPKGTYRTWLDEAALHVPARVRLSMGYWPRKLEFEPGFVLFTMNVEALSTKRGFEAAQAFLRRFKSMLVVDESITIKSPTARRTRALLELRRLAAKRRILTGAPITQSPLDLYTQCAFLDPALLGFKSYYAFRNRYAVMRKVQFGGRNVNLVVGYKNLEELRTKLAAFSYRVTKDECLDLPPKLYQRREVPLSEAQKRVYQELKKFALAELESGELISTTHVLTRLMRLHQITCGFVQPDDAAEPRALEHGRLEALLEIIEECQGKMVVWCLAYRHPLKEVAQALRKRFGEPRVVTYYGDTTPDERVEAIRRFQDANDPARFFVANEAAAYGITLTQAQTVVYYANSYNLNIRSQSEDRAHRIGQINRVTYIDLFAPGTVDEHVLGALHRKQELAALVVDRGLAGVS
jgi:SNF2 family DNA or RNA helicase